MVGPESTGLAPRGRADDGYTLVTASGRTIGLCVYDGRPEPDGRLRAWTLRDGGV